MSIRCCAEIGSTGEYPSLRRRGTTYLAALPIINKRFELQRLKESKLNCIYCKQPIELVPSAAERAKKFGGVPNDYTAVFTYHAACTLELRAKGTAELLRRKSQENKHGLVI